MNLKQERTCLMTHVACRNVLIRHRTRREFFFGQTCGGEANCRAVCTTGKGVDLLSRTERRCEPAFSATVFCCQRLHSRGKGTPRLSIHSQSRDTTCSLSPARARRGRTALARSARSPIPLYAHPSACMRACLLVCRQPLSTCDPAERPHAPWLALDHTDAATHNTHARTGPRRPAPHQRTDTCAIK